MINLKPYLLYLTLLPIISSYAQNNDFGIWYGLELKHKLNKDFNFSNEWQVRTNQNATNLRQWYSELGVNYELNKKTEITLNWRPRFSQDKGIFSFDNRYSIDLQRQFKLKPMYFNLRLRSQYATGFDENLFEERLKLKSAVKINKKNYFYLEQEIFYSEFRNFYPNKLRLGIGWSKELNKKNNLDIKYLINHFPSNIQKGNEFILNMSWSCKI